MIGFDPLIAQNNLQTSFELAPLLPLSEWWHWLLLFAVMIGALAVIVVIYLYDRVELPWGLSVLLLSLRVTAFILLVFFFCNLEKRTERRIVKTSRVALLVDTSLSMGLRDGSFPAKMDKSRIDQVIAELEKNENSLLAELRKKHDVVAYRFDQAAKPVEIASLPKIGASDRAETLTSVALKTGAQAGESLGVSRASLEAQKKSFFVWAAVAGGVLLVSLAVSGVFFLMKSMKTNAEASSWVLLIGVWLLVIAAGLLAAGHLTNVDVSLLQELGLQAESQPTNPSDKVKVNEQQESKEPPVDWTVQLRPRGVETRLGDTMRYLINKERGGPIAGVVVFSDGGNNAGVEVAGAVAAARDAKIPVYTIGLGSTKRPVNIRVVDLQAPPRVYPGDRFTITAYLQAHGLQDRIVKAELLSAAGAPRVGADDKKDQPKQSFDFEEDRRVTLGKDGELIPLTFELSPAELGRRTYKLRVEAPKEDHDSRDNSQTAVVEVVDRKNKVLLLAGGPTREYRFLRNLLYRDRDTTLDVWLQIGVPGISQESDELLYEFPSTAEELFEYDCIAAFDPDWSKLNEVQVQLLERWVSEKAGGLILVAGPVFTPQLSSPQRNRRTDTIKGLYPVIFYSRNSPAMRSGRYGGDTAWQLQFTRAGMEAEHLWLDDTNVGSEQVWSTFEGVYGYYAVKDPKPGAQVYARFSDPETALDGELPIYMASHYYGAGRVFYMSSGEMWRIRSLDPTYFEKYYTKLIRWASQGRLLRDSARGILRVDKDRCLLGDDVGVQAILTDAQHQPLRQKQISVLLVKPDGGRTALILREVQGAGREGMFEGQFPALQEGDYRIELKIPDAPPEEEYLTREVRVRIPDLEIEKPQRNDALLTEVAQKTGAEYFVGVSAAVDAAAGRTPVYNLLEPQDQETFLPGSPDPGKRFKTALMGWLLTLLCGVLCLEWTIRRLNRLA